MQKFIYLKRVDNDSDQKRKREKYMGLCICMNAPLVGLLYPETLPSIISLGQSTSQGCIYYHI